MDLTLHIWRQKSASDQGAMQAYPVSGITGEMSFLEMLDVLNEQLISKGEAPVHFDNDCREGICGTCSLVIDGVAHGPDRGATVCQLHMRRYKDGDEIWIEPFRAKAFPVMRDLIVDRNALDRIVQAGAFISTHTGEAPDANATSISKSDADAAFEAAACIGCGACVAACKNASAMLFVSAKVVHFAKLPQGQPERSVRALSLVEAMDREGFGNCTNQYECEAVCPKEIPASTIAAMNRDYLRAGLSTSDYK